MEISTKVSRSHAVTMNGSQGRLNWYQTVQVSVVHHRTNFERQFTFCQMSESSPFSLKKKKKKKKVRIKSEVGLSPMIRRDKNDY